MHVRRLKRPSQCSFGASASRPCRGLCASWSRRIRTCSDPCWRRRKNKWPLRILLQLSRQHQGLPLQRRFEEVAAVQRRKSLLHRKRNRLKQTVLKAFNLLLNICINQIAITTSGLWVSNLVIDCPAGAQSLCCCVHGVWVSNPTPKSYLPLESYIISRCGND